MSDLQKHRISVQETLLMFADKLKTGYTQSKESMVYAQRLKYRVRRKIGSETPTTYILNQEKEAKRIAYDAEQLQRFVNGFDNLSISLLQPYIMFEKYSKKHDKTFYLNLNEANIASFKSFLDGSLTGRGSIGFDRRKNPGGFGIKNLELEYLANEKSGYSFTHYKLDLEIFCASMEDLLANLGTSDSPYTLLDVLIAFPEDIAQFLKDVQSGSSGGELSSAYKTVLEMGYNVADSQKDFLKKREESKMNRAQKKMEAYYLKDKKPVSMTKGYSSFTKLEDKNYSESTKILLQQQSVKNSKNEQNFSEKLKGMRFRVFLTPFKWTFDVQQKGNITLKISYMGYDSMIASKMAANVMATVDEVKKYQAKYKKPAANKPIVDSTRSAKESEEAKKQAEKDKKKESAEKSGYLRALQPELCFRPYQELGLLERCFTATVDFAAFEQKKEAPANTEGEDLTARVARAASIWKDEMETKFGTAVFMEGFKKMYKGYRVTPKEVWEVNYDIEKIMDATKHDAQLTIENQRIVGGKEVTRYAGGADGTAVKVTNIEGGSVVSDVPYFYLGDLLALFSVFVSQNLQSSGEFPQGTSVRFVTDKIKVPAPWVSGAEIELNIAEVPISWDFFMDWWRDRVLSKTNLVYKLEEFLQEFFGHFMTSLFRKSDNSEAMAINIGCHCIVKDVESEASPGAKHISYYLYQKNTESEPFVRFYIGNAKGLLKDVQFEMINDQVLSSSYMQMAAEGDVPDNNLQFQRAIYNCSITMFGNAIFQPGMIVEVVPSIVGVPFSSTPTMRNIYDLGIGGVFAVTATKVSLRQGNFETTLSTRWISKPVMNTVSFREGGDEQIMDQVYSNYGGGGYVGAEDQNFSVVRKPVELPGPVKP